MLNISATVVNASAAGESAAGCRVTLRTNGREQELAIPQKPDGRGLAANGGELLCLALATCFCNDLYREAGAMGIVLAQVEVEARSTFGARGEPATALACRVRVVGDAPVERLRELVERTDAVAEVHNTLRLGMPVTLEAVDPVSQAARPT